MPPKQKVTKDMIIDTALAVVRAQGHEAVNARSIAAALGCSTQPVFSNFDSMDQLKLAVVEAADAMFREFMNDEIRAGKYPPYKASGMAYIRFAREERELFKLLYMRDRRGEKQPSQTQTGTRMDQLVNIGTGLSGDEASIFHLEMWTVVHGLAVMAVTDHLDLEEELVSRMLTDCFQGLKKQYGKE